MLLQLIFLDFSYGHCDMLHGDLSCAEGGFPTRGGECTLVTASLGCVVVGFLTNAKETLESTCRRKILAVTVRPIWLNAFYVLNMCGTEWIFRKQNLFWKKRVVFFPRNH